MKFVILSALLVSTTQAVPRPYMRLTDNLGEPKDLGFCMDLKGWGPKMTFDNM